MSPTARWALVLVLALPASAAAQPFHLEDTLRDGSSGGNPIGGSFGTAGWTVTGVGDRIWYALPRLGSGYVEVTVANVTAASLPLADHEILAMYEDGYGIGEPIEYAPAFRVNHYKALVRIYGTAEPERFGFMKLMWGMCPSGAPGYDTCGCSSFFEEPFDDPGTWTGAPVRLRLEWGAGRSRLLRDGVEVVAVDWSDSGLSFGPSELHFMLGSPRNDGSLSSMPIGAVFSDLVIDGTMGPLATCPGAAPDAGVTGDAGVCTGAATADATAASWESGVYPDATDLNVEGGAGAVVYLRFPAVSGPVSRATLTLRTASSASAGGGSGEVCVVEGSFDEATLTFGTRPTVSAQCTGGARTVGPSEVVTWDVTSLITPGREVSLAIVSSDPDGAHYASREVGCAAGPRLDVELAPALDGGALDGGALDAPIDGAVAMDAGERRGLVGCGCSVGSRRSPFSLALVALLALGLARGRDRRRA